MKTLLIFLYAFASIYVFTACTGSMTNDGTVAGRTSSLQRTVVDFYALKYMDISGKPVSMSSYKGKYVLCVNVASECGNTPQYTALQKLYDEYKDKLVIIGFPCNQFGKQEPGSEKEIEDFCKKNYGVTFPLASKIDVKGENQHPVYAWLTSKALNGVEDSEVKWNFAKYLVSPQGQWLKSFSVGRDPVEVGEWLK